MDLKDLLLFTKIKKIYSNNVMENRLHGINI